MRRWAAILEPHGWGRGHRYAWRGQEVWFQQGGEGLPVVLLHSLGPGHDGEEWERSAELLARGFDLVAPDLPGFGLSARCLLDVEIEVEAEMKQPYWM